MFNFLSWFSTYRDAIMMMKLACDEFFGIVVNVGWEEFTEDFSAHDIGECSQVKGETWRYVDARKPTLAAFENIISTNVGNVEVGEFVSFKVGVSHSSICAASAESFTTNSNDLNCRDQIISKVMLWKLEGKKRSVTQVMPDCYKKRKTLPLEPFDEETSINNTSRCLLSS